jgi:hypothetical protein
MSYVGLIVWPLLLFWLWWKRRARLRRNLNSDQSDKPPLHDTFAVAPDKLTAPIAGAGGDSALVVQWFEVNARRAYRFIVAGQQAIDAWSTLRGQSDRRGYWPIIIGPNDSVRCHNDSLEANAALVPEEILKKAAVLDITEWQRQKQRSNSDCDSEYERPVGEGDWPSSGHSTLQPFQAPLEVLSQQPYKQVWIGLIPVRNCWEVAAFMRFGDWNEVPPPEVHVALHKQWHKQYGAELVRMTSDILEFQVGNPPKTAEEARLLAELQYDYCPDIVEQGLESIKTLAATLLNGERWYFWWD